MESQCGSYLFSPDTHSGIMARICISPIAAFDIEHLKHMCIDHLYFFLMRIYSVIRLSFY